MANIFDLKDISDIPEEIVLLLSRKKFRPASPIEDLLKDANHPLSVDEIIVSFYRKNGIDKFKDEIGSKKKLISRLYTLVNKGTIKKIGGIKRGERGVKFFIEKICDGMEG